MNANRDQLKPQPGEEVDYGYPVAVTITKADSHGHGP